MDEKLILDLKLSKATDPADVEAIKGKMDSTQGQIDQIMNEVNGIEVENMKYYYVEPALLKKYNAAKDSFADSIVSKYWKGKSSLEDKKNGFPLVELKVNGKQKAVEITLWKGIENSSKADQYIAIIKELMPKDIPWFVSYGDYAKTLSCTSRTGPTTCSPLIGGIEIGVDVNPSTQNGCTLGFKATRNSDNALGFVTAGHCEVGQIPDMAGDQSYTQPTYGSNVGLEKANTNKPAPRYSDTLLFVPSINSNLGRIHQGIGVDRIIEGKGYTQLVGDSVEIFGASSDHKTGTIVETGKTEVSTSYGGNIVGQNTISFPSVPGDSGAPVYHTNLATGNVKLYGDIWGTESFTGHGVFSPISGIEFDQGVLQVN